MTFQRVHNELRWLDTFIVVSAIRELVIELPHVEIANIWSRQGKFVSIYAEPNDEHYDERIKNKATFVDGIISLHLTRFPQQGDWWRKKLTFLHEEQQEYETIKEKINVVHAQSYKHLTPARRKQVGDIKWGDS